MGIMQTIVLWAVIVVFIISIITNLYYVATYQDIHRSSPGAYAVSAVILTVLLIGLLVYYL